MESIVDMDNVPSLRIVRKDMSIATGFNCEVDEAFKDYKTAISETVRCNLELLEEVPLPKSLSLAELKEFFRKDITSDLSKDATFEKSVEVGKYASNMSRYMSSYFKEIFALHDKLRQELNRTLFHVAKVFLNSDLPISYFRTVEHSILAHEDYIVIFDKEIRREHRDLIINLNNKRKFDRVCETHNKWVETFEKRSESIECERMKLYWYIDFNNSASIDEIFKDKFIRLESLDNGVLQQFLENLQKYASDLEKLNYSRTTFEPLSASELDHEGRTILALMKIVAQ